MTYAPNWNIGHDLRPELEYRSGLLLRIAFRVDVFALFMCRVSFSCACASFRSFFVVLSCLCRFVVALFLCVVLFVFPWMVVDSF